MDINQLVLEAVILETYNYEVKTSRIHGKGIFAKIPFTIGINLGVALSLKPGTHTWNDQNVTRTDLGKYTNHSETPNIKIVKSSNKILYVTIKNIQKDEELFVDYNTFPFEGNIPI